MSNYTVHLHEGESVTVCAERVETLDSSYWFSDSSGATVAAFPLGNVQYVARAASDVDVTVVCSPLDPTVLKWFTAEDGTLGARLA
jgi:hypothetical protein